MGKLFTVMIPCYLGKPTTCFLLLPFPMALSPEFITLTSVDPSGPELPAPRQVSYPPSTNALLGVLRALVLAHLDDIGCRDIKLHVITIECHDIA